MINLYTDKGWNSIAGCNRGECGRSTWSGRRGLLSFLWYFVDKRLLAAGENRCEEFGLLITIMENIRE